jgi:hypothetical protein
MFLPKRAGLFQVDSLLRLDELQSVFTSHLDPTNFALMSDLEGILIDQVQYLLTQRGPNSYSELRQLLLST